MNARLLHRSELSVADERALFTLFTSHFENVSMETFIDDLDEKNWMVLLEDPKDGALRGFSTLHVYDTHYRGTRIGIVYSGDTVVSPDARANMALSRSWIGAVNWLRDEFLGHKSLYWLLLVSGYRTYRFLPVFWRSFYRRVDDGDSSPLKDMLHALAVEKFGTCYDPVRGIVRFAKPQILLPGIRGISSHRLRDPHVAFFARQNPGHEQGDELACLTQLSWSNLTPAGQRMWLAGADVFSETRQSA